MLTSLSHRFFLFLGAVLAIAVLALVLIGRWVVMPALLQEEYAMANGELDRIERNLAYGQSHLLAHTRDWAHWDDTFWFIQGKHETYSQANFSRQMFDEMHYQAMLFFTKEGDLHWAAGIDPDTDLYSSCSTFIRECAWVRGLIEAIQPQLEGVSSEGESLLLTFPWPALVAASSILPTSREGTAGGWLVKVRLLDGRMEESLSAQTGLPVLLDSLSMTALQQHTRGHEPGSTLVEHTGEGEIAASRFLASHQPDDMLWLSTQLTRDRFRASTNTFRYALFWTAGLLLIIIAIVLILLESMVLAPLRRFSRFTKQLHQVHVTEDMPAPLLQRRDEIGTLAREFQALLSYQRQQTARLLDLSQHDPLTGVANRRLFDDSLALALENLPTTNACVSVLMLDVDHFKLYNDHYGHPMGDTCLVAIAACMEGCLGGQGFLVARTGGEEFSILLEGVTLEEAHEHADALRQTIVKLGLPHAASPTAEVVTASIGVACCSHIQCCGAQVLMKAADQALYLAKAAGRNRVRALGIDRESTAQA